MEENIRKLLDAEALRVLAAEFAAFLDSSCFTTANTGRLFTPEAVMSYPNGASASGLSGIAELNAGMNGLFEFTFSTVSNLLTAVSGDRAELSFQLTVIHKLIPPSSAVTGRDLFIAFDRAAARAERTAAGWKLSRVELTGVCDTLASSVEGPPIPGK